MTSFQKNVNKRRTKHASDVHECTCQNLGEHYNDVIMSSIASQITSLTVVNWTLYSDADQRKHQSSVWLTYVWGIHRDRWIPRTKGQLRGKCFHLMTSSWSFWYTNRIITGEQDQYHDCLCPDSRLAVRYHGINNAGMTGFHLPTGRILIQCGDGACNPVIRVAQNSFYEK